jgi:hypothetical protein
LFFGSSHQCEAVQPGVPSSYRLQAVRCRTKCASSLPGPVATDQFDAPLTRKVVADAAGSAPAHVNRKLQRIRTAAARLPRYL